MTTKSVPQPTATKDVVEEQATSEGGSKLEAFLPSSEQAPAEAAAKIAHGMRSARLIGVTARKATLQIRGEDEPREVGLDPDVDAIVILDALETGERVMVEADEEGEWVVVGVLRSRHPEKLKLSAAVIEIEADREVLLRSGRGAMRIREDGDVEIVGSRISAASRGLFRLVGRMLRLN